ncbi:MAG: hypothetical protein HQK79_13330 [Desulfobacterales bacterium]|nr:hypothetical protein [Desulfobacterales bacterium]
MSIEEMLQKLGAYNLHLLLFFIATPTTAFVYGKLHKAGMGNYKPHKYIYSVLIYLASFPGIFASVITAYSLFITRNNLLKVNFIVYILPIISMIITIIFIKKNAELEHLPGFDRLLGLFALLGTTFLFVIIILKTKIWLVFGGTFESFILLIIFLFAILKWGAHMLFYNKSDPKIDIPKFPNN